MTIDCREVFRRAWLRPGPERQPELLCACGRGDGFSDELPAGLLGLRRSIHVPGMPSIYGRFSDKEWRLRAPVRRLACDDRAELTDGHSLEPPLAPSLAWHVPPEPYKR